MTEQEFIDNMKLLLEPINNKLERLDIRMDNLENRIGNLENRINNFEYETKRNFREAKQDIHTLVTVLEAKGILQKAQ